MVAGSSRPEVTVEVGGLFYDADQLEGWIAQARINAHKARPEGAPWSIGEHVRDLEVDETVCGACGRPNPVWNAPTEEWTVAARALPGGDGAVVCPLCFVAAWEKQTGRQAVWRVAVDERASAFLLEEGRDG